MEKYDHINISRHHYDDARNAKIFRSGNVSLEAGIAALPERIKQRIRFNTTMIQGEIDSVEEVLRFITFGNRLGIYQFMFAELTTLSEDGFYDKALIEYTKANQFDASSIWEYFRIFGTPINTVRGIGYRGNVVKLGKSTIVTRSNKKM